MVETAERKSAMTLSKLGLIFRGFYCCDVGLGTACSHELSPAIFRYTSSLDLVYSGSLVVIETKICILS